MAILSGNASVAGLVIFGTFSSLAAKIAYELSGPGRDGRVHNFEKPWAMTMVMFLGMSLCLPLALVLERQDRKRYAEAVKAASEAAAGVDGSSSGLLSSPLLGSGPLRPPPPALTWKETFLLGIPTAFDLVATVLMNVGLLTVTASVYQMMRGAEMLFAALFAVTFLKRGLNRLHGLGILACVAGILLVGLASTLAGEGSASKPVSRADIVFGMGLIVASQAVQAAQLTFEDFFMSDLAIEPLKIVGYEGVFGALACALVALPAAQLMPGADGQGVHEDTFDTLHMIFHTPGIAIFLLLDMLALASLNISGMFVTGHFGAVFRTVLETTRTLFVWIVDIILKVLPIAGGRLGESLNRYSPIQALGFCVLVTGTVVYGRGDDRAAARLAAAAGAAAAGDAVPAAAPPPTGPRAAAAAAPTALPGGAIAGSAPATALGVPVRRRGALAADADEDALSTSAAPAPIPIAGSLRSTMTFTTFSASLPRSMPRNLPPIRTSYA